MKNKVHKILTPMEIGKENKRWVCFLHDLLETKKVSRIGILKHWYKLGLENEDLKINLILIYYSL